MNKSTYRNLVLLSAGTTTGVLSVWSYWSGNISFFYGVVSAVIIMTLMLIFNYDK